MSGAPARGPRVPRGSGCGFEGPRGPPPQGQGAPPIRRRTRVPQARARAASHARRRAAWRARHGRVRRAARTRCKRAGSGPPQVVGAGTQGADDGLRMQDSLKTDEQKGGDPGASCAACPSRASLEARQRSGATAARVGGVGCGGRSGPPCCIIHTAPAASGAAPAGGAPAAAARAAAGARPARAGRGGGRAREKAAGRAMVKWGLGPGERHSAGGWAKRGVG